ncbi:hypothetical protein DICPUDRAFT_148500 [Dictyostelium purpureum]|uniref:Tc1-like transposase DDE domain-containing protein n=1 Tax=Dictyostelium purpureum TaxID=5786 RepID=F0ZBA3_DICPU|nr:uncharacterized protein DICPUDRAFT_148500 [Dictyostelium purpureum]EGC38784.1 hypothetical protein DICPUDRAFT_148500 [Dictyostelium purpureum]|eukprot:XP_003284678.1 hypothetical protein DICPUDRAFT_148500 [Dictyostelium purpureum]
MTNYLYQIYGRVKASRGIKIKLTAPVQQEDEEENNIQVDPLPPYSLDISIIINIWSIVKERVSKKMFSDPSQDQVWVCQDAFHSIVTSIIESLYGSLPDRIDAIYKSRG